MKQTNKITELNHDDLVNLLSTALYGCDFLSDTTDPVIFNRYKNSNLEYNCLEDILAEILLGGDCISFIDLYDDEEGENYNLNLNDIIKACNTKDGKPLAKMLFEDETGDYFIANSLLQIALFGKIIYG